MQRLSLSTRKTASMGQHTRCPPSGLHARLFRDTTCAVTAAVAQAGPSVPTAFERLMQNTRLTTIAQELWQQVVQPGDTVVDATCGNGHDTLFLARAVGRAGVVYSFDVQETAVAATRALLHESIPADEMPALHVLQQSHAAMQEVLSNSAARLVVFNLGYLPGSDKAVVTQQFSTVQAVQAACEVLQPGGLLSVLAYSGHAGGVEEYAAVRELATCLPPSKWICSQLQLLNRPTAPILLLAWKRPEK